MLVVGCGGTGSILLPPLTKLLMYHPRGTWNITICDGKAFKPHNLKRQICDQKDLGVNKALSLAKKLPANVNVIPEYVDENNVSKIIAGLVPPCLLITTVDNAATRKLLITEFDNKMPEKYVLICPGNGYNKVQVSTYKEGIFPHPFERYRNIAAPEDSLPTAGCEDLQASLPQLISANMLSASITLNIVNNLLDKNEMPMEVFGDVRRNKVLESSIKKNLITKESVEEEIPERKIVEFMEKSSDTNQKSREETENLGTVRYNEETKTEVLSLEVENEHERIRKNKFTSDSSEEVGRGKANLPVHEHVWHGQKKDNTSFFRLIG